MQTNVYPPHPVFGAARWIFTEAPTDRPNLYADFYIDFASEEQKQYILRISVFGDFAVYLDRADLPVAFHAYTDDEKHKTYEEIDLTVALTAGNHRMKITVYSPNRDFSTYRKNPPALRFLLTENGAPIAYSTERTLCRENPHYESGDGVPTVSGQLGYAFAYDATAEAAPLASAVIVGGVSDELCPRPIPELLFSEPVTPTCIKEGLWQEAEEAKTEKRVAVRMQKAVLHPTSGNPDGKFAIYDLGKEETGYLQITTNADAPTELYIGYGEHLCDGRCRTAIGGRNFAVTLKVPAGKFTFFAPFLRLGLRYLQVMAKSERIDFTPAIVLCHYPVTEEPLAAPKGTIHETIERVARHTLHLCMHDHYEDCPWREQALYALDGRSEMLTAFYAFKETKLTAASLRLMASSIREDNLLELCSPARVPITIPYFSAAFVLALGEYYLHSGDEETVNDLLPVAYDILSGYYGRMKHHGWLLPSYRQKQYWNFYEWQEGLTESIGKESDPEALTFDAPLMALVSMAFTAYADTLTAIGKKNNDEAMIDQGDAVLHCSEELNEQLNNYFYDEEKGLYRTYLSVSLSDGSPYPPEKPHYAELTQELAVLCGAAQDGNHLDDLLDRIHHRTEMIPSTLASALFRYEALLKAPERYSETVKEEIAERFGRMLKMGATTFWETDKGESDFSNAGSLCHGWSAFPAYLYVRYRDLLFGKDEQDTTTTHSEVTDEAH